MAGKAPLTFKIYKGDQFLREETLAQPVIKVGKLSSSHLRLDDDSVSRMHAVIEVAAPGDISIIDLGSTKGTLVNGQKVNKAKLQEGDEIVLGDIRLELSLAGVAAAAAEEEQPTQVNVPAAPAAPPATPPAAAARPPVAPPPAAPPPGMPAAAPSAPPAAPGMGAAVVGGGAGAAAAAFSGGNQVALGAESIDDITGARAVEVAGMLGDSVVGVKHVMNPRGGKITGATYGLAIGGALLVLVAAVAFFKGVGVAAYNKEAQHHWTQVEKKPLHEFRPGVVGGPKRLGALYDWLAIGGGLGGLICMTAALVRYRRESVQPFFRIGSGPEVDFALDGAGATTFPLVAPRGDDFVFNFSPNWEGEMTVGGQSVPLAELQAQGRAAASSTAGAGALEVPIQQDARFRVNTGSATFLVSSVPQPKKQKVPLFAIEAALLVFFGGSALFHFGTVALLKSIPPDPASLALDSLGADGRLSRVNTKATEDPKQEEEESDENDGEREGGTGEKMALDEGKMGKKESTRATGQFAMKNNNADPQLAKQQAIDAARNAGVLGVLSSQQGGAFASLTGTADFSSGLDDRDVYGGLLGNEVGEMAGGWGYGISGVGPGGGGTGWGTIGTGKYGTIGHGSGTGSGYGTGSGRGGMRGRKARPPSVKIGNASATGDLDKNIIRRYIRRKLPRIRNCYEKQLLVNTSLSGTVVTQFQISPQGSVLNASASGVDPTVASCVASAIKSIRFPKPKGGGLVNVRYPFTFRPAGG